MGTLIAGMSIETARIPELSPLTVDLPLELADQVPIYIASENLTKKVPLSLLNTFFNTGGGSGSHAPVSYGGEMIYVVPNAAADTDTAYIPSLAGKDFTLERGGFPLIALLDDNSNVDIAEYEILDAGGFKLLQAGDVLNENERFKLSIFALIGSGTSGPSTVAGSFIGGKKLVTTNTTLDPVLDMNKIIQVRSDATAITITIPNVDDIPVNALIPIETSINNTKPTAITTTGGQYIYFNNVSRNTIHMHPGEVCWLFRDDDGLYIINDFYKHYRGLCQPVASYEVGFDEVLCKGQLVNRADYPRIWEKVANLGFSLVSEATWATASVTVAGRTVAFPYRGCFTPGDGSTTFRLPDLMGQSLRGLVSESGSDTERHLNKPGGYQRHEFAAHQHDLGHYTNDSDGGSQQNTFYLNNDNGPTPQSGHLTVAAGGAETRMDNIGVYWVMKK